MCEDAQFVLSSVICQSLPGSPILILYPRGENKENMQNIWYFKLKDIREGRKHVNSRQNTCIKAVAGSRSNITYINSIEYSHFPGANMEPNFKQDIFMESTSMVKM